MNHIWGKAARGPRPLRRRGAPARSGMEKTERSRALQTLLFIFTQCLTMPPRGPRQAVLKALEEWKDGYAYSRQLVDPVSRLIEKPVTEKQLGQLLSQHLTSGHVTRIYGEKAYLWKIR